MALQRKNFRCPLHVGHVGGAGSSNLVVPHAELPPRARRRVQVGSTNLARSLSTPVLPASPIRELERRIDGADPVVPDGDDRDVSKAAHYLGETNILLLKPSVNNATRVGDIHSNPVAKGLGSVVCTAKRQSYGGPWSTTDQSSCQANDGRRHHNRDGRHTQDGAKDDGRHMSRDVITSPKVVTSTATAEVTRSERDHALFLATRQKLYDAFVDKYGSVRAVFKAFDGGGSGLISYQRFHDMVEASEVGLGPKETSLMFQHVDKNGDNAIAFNEFAVMFAASEPGEESSPCSPIRDGGDSRLPPRDPSSSLELKFRAPLDLSPRTRERVKQLRLKVNSDLQKKHGRELSVHGGKTENLLIYAFKQFDGDNDGFLSYEQVKSALGKEYLQLDMQASEMDEMVRMIDRNSDEKISMKEFVQYFGAGERELPTDMIDNGRTKALAALHMKASVELTPRDEVDPAYFAQFTGLEGKPQSPPLPLLAPATGGCMQENLCRRIATSPVFRSPPLSSSQSTPMLRSSSLEGNDRTSEDVDASGHRRRKTVLGPPLSPLSTVSQDRFRYWREQRTDWSRVGVGGDGVQPNSAFYSSERERFATTISAAFSPIRRSPHNGDIHRDQPSTASEEAAVRASRRQARYARTQYLLEEMEVARAQEKRVSEWKARAKVRNGAERQFGYLDRIHDQEHRVAMRETNMQRRHGGVRFHRMWAGSPDSQFNHGHHQASTSQPPW